MVSREAWLRMGESLALKKGARGLTISALCASLGVTKGSFYHHFQNIQEFKAALQDVLKLKVPDLQLEKESSDTKKSRWYEIALAILKSEGYAGVTLEALIQQMAVTKGAFYYLFQSRELFIKELLTYWSDQTLGEMTRIIKRASDDPEAAVNNILALSEEITSRREVDVQIRAWALVNPHVARYQKNLDKHQLEATRIVMRQMLRADDEIIESISTIAYLSFIGSQHLMPPMTESTWANHLNALRPLLQSRGAVL